MSRDNSLYPVRVHEQNTYTAHAWDVLCNQGPSTIPVLHSTIVQQWRDLPEIRSEFALLLSLYTTSSMQPKIVTGMNVVQILKIIDQSIMNRLSYTSPESAAYNIPIRLSELHQLQGQLADAISRVLAERTIQAQRMHAAKYTEAKRVRAVKAADAKRTSAKVREHDVETGLRTDEQQGIKDYFNAMVLRLDEEYEEKLDIPLRQWQISNDFLLAGVEAEPITQQIIRRDLDTDYASQLRNIKIGYAMAQKQLAEKDMLDFQYNHLPGASGIPPGPRHSTHLKTLYDL